MEQRGWLARTVLPHQSKLAALRKEAAQLVQALETSALAIKKLSAAQPEALSGDLTSPLGKEPAPWLLV
jgi:hypothetical protein